MFDVRIGKIHGAFVEFFSFLEELLVVVVVFLFFLNLGFEEGFVGEGEEEGVLSGEVELVLEDFRHINYKIRNSNFNEVNIYEDHASASSSSASFSSSAVAS